MLFDKFEHALNRQAFIPKKLSIFFNPLYITRKALSRTIAKNTQYMKGIMLDFGCGKKPYKEFFKVDKYIGLDIEVSGHNHEDSEVDVFYDGNNIPFEDEYFDSIFCSEVFEHVYNIDTIIKELYRVLKPGSNMLVSVPFVWDEHEEPYDYLRFSVYGIKKLLRNHGFKIVKSEKTTGYVETVLQLWNHYLIQLVFSRNIVMNVLSKSKFLLQVLYPVYLLLFIAPINILSLILPKILPSNTRLYTNSVIIVRKPAPKAE